MLTAIQQMFKGVRYMEIRIRDNSVEIEGYVNAVERLSKPLHSRSGMFTEKICKGAFKRALKRNDDVRLFLNHNWLKDLGGTKDGNVELEEDNIGLRIRATVSDKDVVKKARHGDLVGFSFGFSDRDVDEHYEHGMMTRDVKDLDLYEVSILDRTKTPAYDGTLLNVRDEAGTNKVIYFGEESITKMNIRGESFKKAEEKEEEKKIDYSAYEKMIAEMRKEQK